jgi:adenylate cyclase
MSRENVTLAILFADVAKSTSLYERLGNTLAQQLIGNCLSVFSRVTDAHGGQVIKTIGDEIMCTFPTATDAVEAGIEMQEALAHIRIPDRPDISAPNIYVGIHFGPVIREKGDVFGDAVNVAARMVSQAQQRQIFTTNETVSQLTPELQNQANWVDKTNIKGKTGEMELYEIVWEQQDVTIMLDSSTMETQVVKSRLEVEIGDQRLQIDENRPAATMGRQNFNDVVVNDDRVSRSHARIEHRRGKFYLTDTSTNGTYLQIKGKQGIYLRRDETQLLGSGIIGLGREVRTDSKFAVHYSVKL